MDNKLITSYKRIVLSIAIFLVLLLANKVNGNVTENIDVSVNKGDAMRVSNLDDFYFAHNIALTGGERIQSDNVCMYSTTGGYHLTAVGLHTTPNGRNFRAFDGVGNYIRYNVFWSPQTTGGRSTFTRVFTNEKTVAFTGADAINETCAGVTNARVQLRVRNVDFRAVPNGVYTDIITLLFEAQ